jgi:hypothetical protein
VKEPLDKLKALEKRQAQTKCIGDQQASNRGKNLTTTSLKIAHLPMWPEFLRGVPNDFIRSPLFNVANHRKKRIYLNEIEIPAMGDVLITYTGEELRQDDEDVLLQILHLARMQSLDCAVEFVAAEIIKSLRWTKNTRSYDRLKTILRRLNATSLTISNREGSRGFSGSLIRAFEWKELSDQPSRTWKVWLEPKIASLFDGVLYSRVIWEQRMCLGILAKWLHNFYASHAKPFPIKIETLYQYSGSSNAAMRGFRQCLRQALKELIDVGFLEEGFIDKSDRVVVRRAKLPELDQEGLSSH